MHKENEKRQVDIEAVATAVDDFMFFHDVEDVKESEKTVQEMFEQLSETPFADDKQKRIEMLKCLSLLRKFGKLLEDVKPQKSSSHE
jgi:hypothetical protein